MENLELFSLNERYSTTRLVRRKVPFAAEENDCCSETVLFLPSTDDRKGEGGLRTQGCFKSTLPDKPLITIVTVVFNGEKYIEQTILSVLNQTYDNVEYIIIDGCSTDGTLDIIKKYEGVIDYWISEPDIGIYDAMNKDLDLVTGDWVNFMNSGDNFYDVNVVSSLFFNSPYPSNVILYGNHEVRYGRRRRCLKARNIQLLSRGSQFCHQSTFVPATVMKKSRFDTQYRIAADFNFFYTSYRKGYQFIFTNKTIASILYNGLSDRSRIQTVLEFRNITENNNENATYYFFRIFLERVKASIKKVIPIFQHEN